MLIEGNGIEYLGKTRIFLDAKREEGITAISHAHKDHVGRVNKAIASKETAVLAGLSRYKEKMKLDDIEIKLTEAGHILGSRQVEILDGQHITYTGDIRVKDSLFFKGAKVTEPDVLVIESTFGLPKFTFPDQEDTIESMKKWIKTNLSVGRNVIIGGYELGKAQEITRIVNDIDEVPIVTTEIAKYNQIYKDYGYNPGEWMTMQNKDIGRDPSVFIVPVRMIGKAREAIHMSFQRECVISIATGWAVVYPFKKIDRAFPLSDHADFNGLVKYAKDSNPRKIITVHGYKKEFARELRRLGFDAVPIEKGVI